MPRSNTPNRPRLGWLGLWMIAGCDPITTDVQIRVLIPDDDTALQTADNVAVTLAPDGFTDSFSTDGLDFAIEAELDPDDTVRQLSLFVARGETLIAYGSTAPFIFSLAARAQPALFLAYAGTLTSLNITLDLPDGQTLGAYAPGQGVVALASDGSTGYFDDYTFDLQGATPMPAPLPDPADGAFVSDPQGGVARLSWNEGLLGRRFSVSDNAWTTISFDGAPNQPRPGAAYLVDEPGGRILVFGGGELTDVLEITLATEAEFGPRPTQVLADLELDGPRAGAHAQWLRRNEAVLSSVLIGGTDPQLPLLYFVDLAQGAGPTGDWTGGRCTQLDDGSGSEARLLCGGGMRDAQATADAVLVSFSSDPTDTTPNVEILPDFFDVPLSDPIWLSGPQAVYAQGEARLFRIDRSDLSIEEPAGAPLRVSGGSVVAVRDDATYLLGGIAAEGSPVNRWQVFAPRVEE